MKTIAQALEVNNTSKITRNVIKLMVEGTNIRVNDSAEYDFHINKCNIHSSGISMDLPTTSGGWRTINFKTTKECAEWIEKNVLKI